MPDSEHRQQWLLMGKLFNRRTQVLETAVDSDDSLLHVAIAGGTLSEWDLFGPQWDTRIEELTSVMSQSGVLYLSLYPYGPDIDDHKFHANAFDRQLKVNDVDININSSTDGRERICSAIEQREDSEILSENFLDQQLFGRAGNPDLVVVLGSANCLPRSLVWELAYSEIVFVDQSWSVLSVEKIESAIQEYSQRHRRFGGVNT
jgi:undecaprenyl diphosphate synthase